MRTRTKSTNPQGTRSIEDYPAGQVVGVLRGLILFGFDIDSQVPADRRDLGPFCGDCLSSPSAALSSSIECESTKWILQDQ